MAKRLTRTEMKILGKQLDKAAYKVTLAHKNARGEQLKEMNARVARLNKKFLRQHANQILALAELDSHTAREFHSAPYTFDLDICTPLRWPDESRKDLADIAKKYRQMLAGNGVAYVPEAEASYVEFAALDTTVVVPATEHEQWKNLAERIDLAALSGDAMEILDLIKRLTGEE